MGLKADVPGQLKEKDVQSSRKSDEHAFDEVSSFRLISSSWMQTAQLLLHAPPRARPSRTARWE
jgi:hypothetical protein